MPLVYSERELSRETVADRGYFSSPEILACHEAGVTVTLPKPQTSGAKSGPPVCTENLVRVDDVMESPKLAE